MDRRRFLALAGVALAGCSGDDSGTPTAPPTTAQQTATSTVDGTDTSTETEARPEQAAAALDAAEAALATAASALVVEPTPPDGDAVAAAATDYAVDDATVTDALETAQRRLEEAAATATDDQRARLDGLTAYAGGLASLHALYGALVALGEAVTTAEPHLQDGAYAAAAAALSETAPHRETATTHPGTARERLDDSAAVAEAADLPVEALGSILSVAEPVGLALAPLARGYRGVARGVVGLDEGEEAFLDDEYARAVDVFGDAIGALNEAVPAFETARGRTAADGWVAPWDCLAEGDREAGHTLQSGALEADAGNTSEGFSLFRDGREQRRDVRTRCGV